MRQSKDLINGGVVKDGYDYNLQIWIKNYIVQICGHPQAGRFYPCCNGAKYAGQDIRNIAGREIRQ